MGVIAAFCIMNECVTNNDLLISLSNLPDLVTSRLAVLLLDNEGPTFVMNYWDILFPLVNIGGVCRLVAFQ